MFGFCFAGRADRGFELGAVDFIGKPFSLREWVGRASTALQESPN